MANAMTPYDMLNRSLQAMKPVAPQPLYTAQKPEVLPSE